MFTTEEKNMHPDPLIYDLSTLNMDGPQIRPLPHIASNFELETGDMFAPED